MNVKRNVLIAASAFFLSVGAANAQIVVRIGAPPPPPVEVVPARPPHPGWVWVPGYHRWDGHGYVWVPGGFRHPPHAGAVWVAGDWREERGGHVWHPGYWK